MEFRIGEKVKTPINAYIVRCEAMYGDADGYGELLIGPFKRNQDEEHLQDFIQFCERMKREYPWGRGGGDDYNHVEGFNKWFCSDNLSEEEYEALPQTVKDVGDYWLNDPQSDGSQASFEGYSVFYYDENGAKFNVSVRL